MKLHPSIALAVLSVASMVPMAQAQQPAPIPVRPLGRIVATSKEIVSSIVSIRPLGDGRVLVNDPTAKRIVLFDSALATFVTVADTTSETAKAYGAQGGGLFAYAGDSSLFADIVSLSMLVIDPAGKINRVIAAPRGNGNGLAYVRGPAFGATYDGRGNLLSKWGVATQRPPGASGPPPQDSAQIQRANILTKKIDTVARLLAATSFVAAPTTATGTGPTTFTFYRNPMPVADTWTVMSDGTVAIISEIDYHIDWIAPDGTRTSSPRIPHQWEHMSDSMKAAIVDSAKLADSMSTAKMMATMGGTGAGAGFGGGAAVGGGATRGGGGAATRGGTGTVTVDGPVTFVTSNGSGGAVNIISGGISMQYVDPSSLPDYYPPFFSADSLGVGPARTDADDNIWIRTAQAKHIDGGTIFDVVNRQGKLIDRVQIPGGTTIMGFGPGVVYLSARVGTGYQLARAKIH